MSGEHESMARRMAVNLARGGFRATLHPQQRPLFDDVIIELVLAGKRLDSKALEHKRFLIGGGA